MFFKKFDFISSEITLFYRGNENHSSIMSGILSIVMGIVIVFLIGYLSIDVIAKQHPTSFYFTKFIEEIDDYPLNSTALLHYVSLYNSENEQIGIDTKAIYVIGVSVNDGTFTSDNDISKYSHWIYDSCEESDLGTFKDTYTNEQLSNLFGSLCINRYYDKDTNSVINKNDANFIYPTLAHGASQHNNFEYGLYYQRCQNNSVINGNNCYSKSQQDNYISGVIGYEIYFIDHSIDVEQYNNPIGYAVHRITSELNANSFVLNHLNFHPVVVRTNDGLFFDNLKNTISYNFDYNEKITHVNDDYNILGSFNFWMQNTIDTYDRAYKKVQDVAGGIDGILEIAMLIVRFINSFFFNDYQILYDFHAELQNHDKKRKKNKLNNSYFSGNIDNNHNGLNKREKDLEQNVSVSNGLTFNKSIVKRKSPMITNAYINNSGSFSKGPVEKNKTIKMPKKIKWNHYFTNLVKIKKYNYIENLQDKREEVISEEKIIEMDFLITKIKEKMQKDFNFNNPNNTLMTEYENNNDNIDSKNTNNGLYVNTPMPLLLNK